MAVFSVHLVV